MNTWRAASANSSVAPSLWSELNRRFGRGSSGLAPAWRAAALSVRFQADADLNQTIATATREREPSIDFLSAADLRLEGLPDSEVLAQAARNERILITHDRRTMPVHFRARLETGEVSPGVRRPTRPASESASGYRHRRQAERKRKPTTCPS